MSRFTSAVTEQGGQPSRHRRRFGHARPNLQPPLRDLGERLAAAFSLEELRDLAFTAAIEPESVPDDTRQQFALGLARAGWCRGRLGEVLAEAARQRPTRDWTIPAFLGSPRPSRLRNRRLPGGDATVRPQPGVWSIRSSSPGACPALDRYVLALQSNSYHVSRGGEVCL